MNSLNTIAFTSMLQQDSLKLCKFNNICEGNVFVLFLWVNFKNTTEIPLPVPFECTAGRGYIVHSEHLPSQSTLDGSCFNQQRATSAFHSRSVCGQQQQQQQQPANLFPHEYRTTSLEEEITDCSALSSLQLWASWIITGHQVGWQAH